MCWPTATNRRDSPRASATTRKARRVPEARTTVVESGVTAGRAAELTAWLAEAEDAANESIGIADLAAARTAFARGDVEAGLRTFLRLDTDGRAAILAAVDRPELRWLLQLREPAEGVDAVLAMAMAEAALTVQDVNTALAALHEHVRTVRGCADGRALIALAEEMRRERDQSAEGAALRAASDALTVGDLDGAEARLRRISGGAAANALRDRVATARVRQSVAAELARTEAAGDIAEGEALAAPLGPAEAAAFKGALNRKFKPRRFDDVEGALRAFLVDDTSPVPRTWLAPDGRTIVLVRAFGRHLVAWVCEAETLVPQHAWTWRVPAPIRVSGWTIDGEVLEVVAAEIALFRASLADVRVLRWRRPVADEARIEIPTPVSSGRHIWATTGTSREDLAARPLREEGRPQRGGTAAGRTGRPFRERGARACEAGFRSPAIHLVESPGRAVCVGRPDG